MPDETPTVSGDVPGVNKDPVALVNGIECRTFKEMILYKMDRTLAICGLILLGFTALMVKELSQIASTVVSLIAGGLITYIGGKITK